MHVIHTIQISMLCLILMAALATAAAAGDKGRSTGPAMPLDKKTEDRARYVITIAGCNDCHTTGYAEAGGKIPEKDWLKGDSMGWRGPWGTTYASNLRLYMHNLSEDQWIKVSRSVEFRPPMPWFVLRVMTEQDLRAIYRFIRNLGPAGEPAPAYVPPDQEPRGAFILFPSSTEPPQ
ncbi:MAG: cytochrome C [Nitrospira sp. SG-bin1]|nr:MAG: cytochrome C [Nitrospira sp. SG-bin1]